VKRYLWPTVALILAACSARAAQRYPVSGLVVKVDKEHRSMVVSHEAIAGLMDAMVMPFHVRKPEVLEGMQPGMRVDFTLIVDQDSSYADDVRVRSGDSVARDPLQARRLQLLDSLVAPPGARPEAVAIGQTVPDFALTDQNRRRVSLSQFSGKVVAVTFVYTRCPLPDFCLRLSNNFARLQRRFRERMGQDLILLSITFDPKYDQPDVLAQYARTWKADAEAWRFLTGPIDDMRRVYGLFGVDAFPDEGLLSHSLRTAVIDRQGKLAAVIPGNEFVPQELGDLVQAVMDNGRSK
jgi:protein SCO1/2